MSKNNNVSHRKRKPINQEVIEPGPKTRRRFRDSFSQKQGNEDKNLSKYSDRTNSEAPEHINTCIGDYSTFDTTLLLLLMRRRFSGSRKRMFQT
ncbi:hypothetical protein TNCV_4295881 [Trichonephila clavipes]|nr:hypothetical protein TNCV_4295881 [Trichonephila clavipes]